LTCVNIYQFPVDDVVCNGCTHIALLRGMVCIKSVIIVCCLLPNCVHPAEYIERNKIVDELCRS